LVENILEGLSKLVEIITLLMRIYT